MLIRVEEIEQSKTHPGAQYLVKIKLGMIGIGKLHFSGTHWRMFRLPLLDALAKIGDVEFVQRTINTCRTSRIDKHDMVETTPV